MIRRIAAAWPPRMPWLLSALLAPWGFASADGLHLEEVASGRPFLRRERGPYRNFALQNFQNAPHHFFPYTDIPKGRYDSFGNFLVRGYDLYKWDEIRTPGQKFGSAMFKQNPGVWNAAFDYVVAGSDGYGQWGYHFIVGDGLIARFTPLTLYKVDFNGARFDLVSTYAVESPQAMQRADGERELVFLFYLGSEAALRSVAVEALVGNDYHVDVAMVYLKSDFATFYPDRFAASYFHVLSRAEGNVQDLSNLRRRRFDVGENTGHFIYSADLNLQLPGLELSAEYARSSVYSRYPAEIDNQPAFDDAPRFAHRGSAYFLNAGPPLRPRPGRRRSVLRQSGVFHRVPLLQALGEHVLERPSPGPAQQLHVLEDGGRQRRRGPLSRHSPRSAGRLHRIRTAPIGFFKGGGSC